MSWFDNIIFFFSSASGISVIKYCLEMISHITLLFISALTCPKPDHSVAGVGVATLNP